MSVGRTNSGSGGGNQAGNPKSNIAIVVYTSPNVDCICSNGSKTLKFNSLSGTGVFYIPTEGTWTITATDGINSNSKTVTVSSNSIEEVYVPLPLYLYNEGDENISVTGGLDVYPYRREGTGSNPITPTLTKNSASLRITTGKSPTAQAFILACEEKIQLKPFSTVHVQVTENSMANTSYSPWFSFTEVLENSFISAGSSNINGTGEKTMDISNLYGLYYPIIAFAATNNHKFTITKWWLT